MKNKSAIASQKGFTILELMVSIAIFSVVCVSILELVSISSKSNEKNEKTNMATDFASEAIEVVTYMRDNNFLNNRTYTSGILKSDTTFIVLFNSVNDTWDLNFGNDNNSETITSCSTSTNNSCAVYLDKTNNSYTQSRTTPTLDFVNTGFYRLVKVQPFPGYIKIISSVLWKESGVDKIISLEKNLWDWK